MFEKYICGLDLGSSHFTLSVAQIDSKGAILQLFVRQVPAKGMRRGSVENIVEAGNALSALTHKIDPAIARHINSVSVNVSGSAVSFSTTSAPLLLSERGNKVIDRYDLERVKEYAKNLRIRFQDYLLHCIPQYYILDDESTVSNPLGLYGHKLELHALFITAKHTMVENIVKAVEQAELACENIVFSGLAGANVCLTPQEQQHCTFIDIGAQLTEFLFYREGHLAGAHVLERGGCEVTERIAHALTIPFELAEEIKVSHASLECDEEAVEKDILIKKSGFYKTIKQDSFNAIVRESSLALIEALREAYSKYCTGAVAGPVIAGGRAVMLDGFLERLESAFGVPVRMATPRQLNVTKHAALLKAITAAGLLYWGVDSYVHRRQAFMNEWSLSGLVNKMKLVYQDYF